MANLVDELRVKDFRGVLMGYTFPSMIHNTKCVVVDLDASKNNGAHWVCFCRNKDNYFLPLIE